MMILPLMLADVTGTSTPVGVWVVIVALSVGAAAVPMTLRSRGDRRAEQMLQRWVGEQGLDVVRQEVIPGMRGPFAQRGFWTTVFRIAARQPDGTERMAWVCTNNVFLWGGGTPDVIWDA